MSKKRIVKDYDKLPSNILDQVKIAYDEGFVDHLVSYTNAEGKNVSALPFETDEIFYLIRMTQKEAERIVEEDDDYDEEGNLREDFSLDSKDEEILNETAKEEEEVDNSYKDYGEEQELEEEQE